MDNTFEDILSLEPLRLSEWLIEEFMKDIHIPEEINTIEELSDAGKMLAKINNSKTYVTSLLMMVIPWVRAAKRNLDKDEYQDMVDRRNILQECSDALKDNYNALSRLVTIKKMQNDEIAMLDSMG